MCSGCSGDYAGDFEDCDEPTRDSDGDQPAWHNGRSEGNWNPLVMRDLERPTYWQRDSRLGNSPASVDGKVGEGIVDVLVSATRIVEIRVIPANPETFVEFPRGRTAGGLAADKHSQAASAKYYQTSGGIAGAAGDRVGVPIFRRVTARVAGDFRKWIRGIRNAWGKQRSGKFQRP